MTFAIPFAHKALASLRRWHRPIGCGQNAPKPADDGIAPLAGTAPLKFASQNATQYRLTDLARKRGAQHLVPESCERLSVELFDIYKFHILHREFIFQAGLASIL